jgi:hypothetical protein
VRESFLILGFRVGEGELFDFRVWGLDGEIWFFFCWSEEGGSGGLRIRESEI